MIGNIVFPAFLTLISFSTLNSMKTVEEPRIVGGQALQRTEFPWMVSLQLNRNHFCGATIISYELAVTAAHCVDKSSTRNFEVVCGAHSLSSTSKEEQRASPLTVIVHEKWNSTSLSDDIALIRLRDKLNKTANCQTIDLPNDNIVLNPGLECVATGWGRTSAGSKVSDLPRKVSMPLLSQQDCAKMYSKQTKILKTNICAGGLSGKGICSGDSGGPLNCLVNNNWSYVGLDSFTVPCAVKGYPSVFTKVNEYNSWIRSKISIINKNGIK